MDARVLVLLTLLILLGVEFLVLLARAGLSFQQLSLGLRTFWRALRDAEFAGTVDVLLAKRVTKSSGPPRPSGVPLRMLALLQREGRLLDFLLEDIQAYPDAQVGAAVREIHRQCQAALREHMVLEPVLPESEGSTVNVPPGFDPSAIRIVGHVTGAPPFRGTLLHRGWRVRDLRIAALPEGQDDLVLMPAEVELP